MKTRFGLMGLFTLAAALAAPALAQTSGDGLPPPPRVQQAGGIDYLNDGGGAESREAIEKMQSRFMLRNLFSGQGGQYVVAQRVSVRGAAGPLIEIRDAGPVLLIALPPGAYTIEADVGGQVQRKTVQLGAQPLKLNWNWPGA